MRLDMKRTFKTIYGLMRDRGDFDFFDEENFVTVEIESGVCDSDTLYALEKETEIVINTSRGLMKLSTIIVLSRPLTEDGGFELLVDKRGINYLRYHDMDLR